jgi:hypothetical protein
METALSLSLPAYFMFYYFSYKLYKNIYILFGKNYRLQKH